MSKVKPILMTNHLGREVTARSAKGILENLNDPEQQVTHINQLVGGSYDYSFVAHHPTGISLSRSATKSGVVFTLCREDGVLEVQDDEAKDLSELFWKLTRPA